MIVSDAERQTMLAASRGDVDALAALVQLTIANDMAWGLPRAVIFERAEPLARLAAMHGRPSDATVLSMILLASADHAVNPELAGRRRAEAVAYVELRAGCDDPRSEEAANALNILADQLPRSAFADARMLLGVVDEALDRDAAGASEGGEA